MAATPDNYINSVSAPQTVSGEKTYATLWASVDIESRHLITRVWAEIIPPSMPPEPFTIDLKDTDDDGIYEETYTSFTEEGDYLIIIYAVDKEGDSSSSSYMQTYVTRDVNADDYEQDDKFTQANAVTINDKNFQNHNFHDEGDEDWIKFYGISGEIYITEVNNKNSHCDVVIEIIDTDGTTVLAVSENEETAGKENSLEWFCPQDGLYYVKFRNMNPNHFDRYMKYDLRILIKIGPDDKYITGRVTDAISGRPIEGATIKTDGGASGTSSDNGMYNMLQEPSKYTLTLTAEADGYEKFEIQVIVEEDITRNINMMLAKGNVNGDRSTDLADAVLVLQIMVGQTELFFYKQTEINNNKRIGLEEAIYILQKTAELR